VASRLIETYYRPTLVFTKSGDKLAASARSIKDFDVYKALEKCKDHLLQFGGHKYAAGLTLKPEQYDSFKKRFIEVVDQMGKSLDKTPELSIDSELSFDQIDDKFYRILNRMEPFGPDNEKPVFCSKNLRDTGYVKAIGKDNKHLKFQAKDPEANKTFEAIGFGLASKIACFEENANLALAYQLDKNYFRGTESMQLLVKDIKDADSIEN
jgi:single-stranded-DNA-specific exonuclease